MANGTAIPTAVRTALNDQLSQVAVSKMCEDAKGPLEKHPDIVSLVAVRSTTSDQLMSSIVTFVVNTANQEEGIVKYV